MLPTGVSLALRKAPAQSVFSGDTQWGCGPLPAQGQDHGLPRPAVHWETTRGRVTPSSPQLDFHTWTLWGVDAHPAGSLQRDGTWQLRLKVRQTGVSVLSPALGPQACSFHGHMATKTQ